MVKNPPTNVGDVSTIPGSGRSPGVGNTSPLQYSCLANSMEESCRLQSMGCKELDMTEQLNIAEQVLMIFKFSPEP